MSVYINSKSTELRLFSTNLCYNQSHINEVCLVHVEPEEPSGSKSRELGDPLEVLCYVLEQDSLSFS